MEVRKSHVAEVRDERGCKILGVQRVWGSLRRVASQMRTKKTETALLPPECVDIFPERTSSTMRLDFRRENEKMKRTRRCGSS